MQATEKSNQKENLRNTIINHVVGTTLNQCEKCAHCPHNGTCPLYALTAQGDGATAGRAYYKRHSPGLGYKYKEFFVTTLEGYIPGTGRHLSDILGIYGYKRQYPTWIVLLSVTITKEWGVSSKDLCESFQVTWGSGPSKSSINRWGHEWEEYVENPSESTHADLFDPIRNGLALVCPCMADSNDNEGSDSDSDSDNNNDATAAEGTHGLFHLYTTYLNALARFCQVSPIAHDFITEIRKSIPASKRAS